METGRVSRGRRDRLLSFVIPAVLVAVAATQVVVASSTELTAWRGGGFGMFSTIDAHSSRFMRAEVQTDDGRSVPLDMPSFLRDSSALHHEVLEHRAWPRETTFEALVDGLTDTPVTVTDDVAGADPDGEVLPIRTIAVEVWTLEFDPDTSTVTPRRVDARQGAP